MSTESELKDAAEKIDGYAEDCHCESPIEDFVVETIRPMLEKRDEEILRQKIALAEWDEVGRELEKLRIEAHEALEELK